MKSTPEAKKQQFIADLGRARQEVLYNLTRHGSLTSDVDGEELRVGTREPPFVPSASGRGPVGG